jgi:hypothetical protein
MSEPKLTFLYNSTTTDTAYTGSGAADSQWKIITLSGATPDKKVFTGGGINNGLQVPESPLHSRDATIRPLSGRLVIPQVFIESTYDNKMVNVPLAGSNDGQHVFAIYVDGEVTSDLYVEYWDDTNFNTYDFPVLSGTITYSDSMVNAIATTSGSPPSNWKGVTLPEGWMMPPTGSGVCLRGSDSRLRLKGTDSVIDEALYYNMYVSLPYDSPLFHNQPIEAVRYLYV